MLCHSWPGNVRELYNTVIRAVLWSPGTIIDAESAKQSLFALPSQRQPILERPWGNDFALKEVLGEVARHYMERAMRDSGGVKSKAAELLGFNTYQTLSNWIKRHGL